MLNIDPGYIAVAAALFCTYLGYLQGLGSKKKLIEDTVQHTIDSLLEDGYLAMDEEGNMLQFPEENA